MIAQTQKAVTTTPGKLFPSSTPVNAGTVVRNESTSASPVWLYVSADGSAPSAGTVTGSGWELPVDREVVFVRGETAVDANLTVSDASRIYAATKSGTATLDVRGY